MHAILLVAGLVLVQAPRVADDAVSYQTRKQLFEALDVYAENPTAEQAAACGVLIDQMIAAMPRPILNYCIDAAKAAELVGLPDKAMTILRDTAEDLDSEKWPGVGQTVGVGANMWLGRLARDSGQPQQAVEAFLRAADAAAGEYGSVVRSMSLSYAGEVYAELLNQPEEAVRLFEQAEKIEGSQSVEREGQLYKDWAQRNLERLRTGASSSVAPASDMLDAQIFLYPVLNGVALSNSQVMGVYGNGRYKLTRPYLDNLGRQSKSNLDREISQLQLAGELAADQKWNEAEGILKELLGASGFLAPVAAMNLALAYRDQGDPVRAQEILDELASKWPDSGWPRQARRVTALIARQTGASGQANEQPIPPVASLSAAQREPAAPKPPEPTSTSPAPPSRTPQRTASVNPLILVLVLLGSGLLFGILTVVATSLRHRRPV